MKSGNHKKGEGKMGRQAGVRIYCGHIDQVTATIIFDDTAMREILKSREYQWDSSKKLWYKNMCEFEKQGIESDRRSKKELSFLIENGFIVDLGYEYHEVAKKLVGIGIDLSTMRARCWRCDELEMVIKAEEDYYVGKCSCGYTDI